jgi:hypothetical protein
VTLPLLAASDYGLVVAVGVIFLLFLVVGWVILQGTRAQMDWRRAVEQGDTDVINMLVTEELNRWKTIRVPKGTDPAVWHALQSTELADVAPTGVRLNVTAEGQFAMVDGQRREVENGLQQAMKVTAKLADMVMYDIPNVKLGYVQVDVYSTFRDESGSSQRCVLTTKADREVADDLAWDEMTADEVVHAFGGRYSLDDRGNALPINPDGARSTNVPPVFYEDE